MNRKNILILNPTSNKGAALLFKDKIKQYCDENNIDYELRITNGSQSATKIASEYKNCNIYSIGGDGTAYECLNGLDESNYLAIIPFGTGNDFFRMIHNDDSKPFEIFKDTINGKLVEVDYGVCNNFKFLNSFSIGVDAKVNYLVTNYLKKSLVPQSLIYSTSAVITILNPGKMDIKIKFDNGKELSQKSYLVAVMNGKYYGHGVMPSNKSNLQDGKLNITVVDYFSQFKLPFVLQKYLAGKADEIEYINQYESSTLIIDTKKEVYAQIDGEDFKDTHFEINIKKNGLKLLVPNYSNLK